MKKTYKIVDITVRIYNAEDIITASNDDFDLDDYGWDFWE